MQEKEPISHKIVGLLERRSGWFLLIMLIMFTLTVLLVGTIPLQISK